MKGNINKLALVVIIVAIPMLIAAATASAGLNYIKGTYALSGFTSCSVGGGPANASIEEATYTFNKDGTGSAFGWVRGTAGQTDNMYITESFTYTVKNGDIEFQYPDPPGGIIAYTSDDKETEILQWDAGPSHGVISPDGKTMTITCGSPHVLTVIDSPNGPPVGTVGYCAISLSGMRIK